MTGMTRRADLIAFLESLTHTDFVNDPSFGSKGFTRALPPTLGPMAG
jgi:hypothetical protein